MKTKTQSSCQIDRHTTLAQLDALQKEWSELVDEIPDVPVFLTWEWIRTWWFYFGQDRQLWLLTARDKQGKLLGLGPFMREEYKKGLIRLGMITFIGAGRVCPTRLDILARTPQKEELYQSFLGYLSSQSDKWDVLRITSVTQNAPEYDLLMAAGGHIRIGAQVPSPYVPLPHTWETYLKSVSGNLRRNIKVTKSRLESDFSSAVKFAYVADPQDLDGMMEMLEELIRSRCHAKGLFTDWDNHTFRSFHRAIATLALDRGWLRLYTLTVEDRVVALLYNFHFKNHEYVYNMGFDVDWSKYGPGRLLMAYSVQTAIQEAANVLDLGRGESRYKSDWTDQVRVEDEILFSSNWRGKLWITVGNFKRALEIEAKHLKNTLRRTEPAKQVAALFAIELES